MGLSSNSDALATGDGRPPLQLDHSLVVTDTPLSGSTRFNFGRITRTLCDFIVSTPADAPFNICLSGGWGTGKTTLLRSLERSLRDLSPVDGAEHVTVWFDPWKLANEEEVRNALVRRVLELIANDAGFIGGARIDIDRKNVLRVLSERVLRVGMDDVSRFYRAEAATRDTFAEVEDLFRRVADVYLNAQPRRRLVMFVDDLDRCRPARVVEVLEAVKLFFDLPGIVFVFALDRRQLERAAMSEYDFSSDDARVYLEKIFQLTVALPRKPIDDLVRFLSEHLAEVGMAVRDERLARAIVTRFGRNLRDLKLFINSFSFRRSLIEDPDVDLDDEQLFKWLYLESTMPRSLSVALENGSLHHLVLALELLAHGGFLHDRATFNRYVAELQRGELNYCALIIYAIVRAKRDDLSLAHLTAEQTAIIESLTEDGEIVATLRVLREGSERLIDSDLWRMAFLTRVELASAEAPEAEAALVPQEQALSRIGLDAHSVLSAREWDTMGDELRAQGDAVDAYLCYLMALLMEPRSIVYLGDLGRTMGVHGRSAAAMALLRAGYEIDPTAHYIFTETAYLYDMRLEDTVTGNLLYRKALAAGAIVASVPLNLALNLFSEERYREAYLACLNACLLDRSDERKREHLYRFARMAGSGITGPVAEEELEAEMARAVEAGEYPFALTEDDERRVAATFASHPRLEDVAAELSRPPL